MLNPSTCSADTLIVWESLPQFVQDGDAANGYPFLSWLEGGGSLLQTIDTLCRDDAAGNPGWSVIFNVDLCPPAYLPWLAQCVGVRFPPGMTTAQMRYAISNPAGFARGRPAQILAAANGQLLPGYSATIIERTTSPYGSLGFLGPSAPTVTPEGTTGSTSYAYQVVARTTVNATPPSIAGTTTTGNATLSGTSYNLVSWPAVPLPAGSTGNLVYDSNLTNAIAAVGPTWTPVSGTTIGTGPGDMSVLNPGTDSAEFVLYGDGTTGVSGNFNSAWLSVTPGATYTASCVVNIPSDVSGPNNVYLEISSSSGQVAFCPAPTVAGQALIQTTFTIPAGVTSVQVTTRIYNPITFAVGEYVSWSQIQLTETSTVQTYEPGPLWTYDVYGRVAGSPSLIGSTTALAFEDIGQALGVAPPVNDAYAYTIQVPSAGVANGTWADLAASYPTWADVASAYATWKVLAESSAGITVALEAANPGGLRQQITTY